MTETAPPPVIILVRPQMAENIGTAARAMLNCGLTEMRLVAPRDGWPDARAAASAAGADVVLDGVRAFPDLAAAAADLHRLYATTARNRGMSKPVADVRDAGSALRAETAAGRRVGLVFGAERTGLTNDEAALADTLVTVSLNPEFSSLNLAQAVLLAGWEWRRAALAEGTVAAALPDPGPPPAPQAEVEAFHGHLIEELDRCGFLRVREKRPSMIRNLRNLFGRACPTAQELRILHGVVACLVKRSRTHPPFDPDGAGNSVAFRRPDGD